jgi:hypothetical protein
MNASRGSYSLNCKTSNGNVHYSTVSDSPAKASLTLNNIVTSPGHVTRSCSTSNVTSPNNESVVSTNGASNKLLNGQQQSSSANENGLLRLKTHPANGRAASWNGISSDAQEALGNGSADVKSSTPLTSCGHEFRSQLLSADSHRSTNRAATNGVSTTLSATSSNCHRQNGTHNGTGCHSVENSASGLHVSTTTSSRRFQGINGQVVQVTGPAAGNGHVTSSRDHLETTDVDSLQDIVDHPFFTLADDAGQQDSLQIVSSRGTVRGVRNRVKAGIAVFVEQQGNGKQKVSGL